MSHETFPQPAYEDTDLTGEATDSAELYFKSPDRDVIEAHRKRVAARVRRYDTGSAAASVRIDELLDPTAKAIHESKSWMWGTTTERPDTKSKKTLRRFGRSALKTAPVIERQGENDKDKSENLYRRSRTGIGSIALAATSVLQPKWHKNMQARQAERIIANAERNLNAGPLDSPVSGIDLWARYR